MAAANMAAATAPSGAAAATTSTLRLLLGRESGRASAVAFAEHVRGER
jgi:hypothetical protein